ncbi:hypothetical protein [Paraburkholderia dinghuensis]|uniref:Uncharacterized protein n=1 Tax=Paraburkholderia dinghuensis TaxID=2305225 RepID=A0A3N6Q761_9BURK|nr:hypothetical protein [Paraburkholderia dinghuensis]RQH08326.1 hypothetical protein D1Y85_04725 [Paraburkholderia dinghuensis]
MSLRSTSVVRFEALPNPRGGRVPHARDALAEALYALDTDGGHVATPLRHAANALREAGWLGAARFADTLLLASPFALSVIGSAAVHSAQPSRHAPEGDSDQAVRALFRDALADLAAALDRHNLRELSCSPALYARQHSLVVVLGRHMPGISLAYEDVALQGRPIAPATLHALPAHKLAQIRARYESALLPALKARHSSGSRAAAALADAAFDEMDVCLAELASPDPYDYWRLAAACGRALRRGAVSWGDEDVRRFYARCNLLLADHAHGLRVAPQSLVRATLALLWRDYALFGAAAEDTDDVELLRDHGLTVDWHIAGTQASEVLWEAGAAQADATASGVAPTRELGALAVNANAYEDFLQTADASMAALSAHAEAWSARTQRDAAQAVLAADASYGLGAAAWAIGLGHVGLLADALGLAWRRTAHAAGQSGPLDLPLAANVTSALDAAAVERAGESLRAMLHKIAAGVAQPDAASAVRALAASIAGAAALPERPDGAQSDLLR